MFKAGTTGTKQSWRGVIRDSKGKVVWTCPHCHTNRDISSRHTESASSCAKRHLEAATNPQFGAWLGTQSINNPMARPSDVRRVQDAQARAQEVRSALGLRF